MLVASRLPRLARMTDARPPSPAPGYRFDRFELRPAERALRADGQPVKLGGRAFDMLVALVERRDRVVGKHELGDSLLSDWLHGGHPGPDYCNTLGIRVRLVGVDGPRIVRELGGEGEPWVTGRNQHMAKASLPVDVEAVLGGLHSKYSVPPNALVPAGVIA